MFLCNWSSLARSGNPGCAMLHVSENKTLPDGINVYVCVFRICATMYKYLV